MSVFWSITFKTTAPQNVTENTEGISQFQLHPALPLPADPRALAFFFFCLGWQIPGGGESWAVKSPGVGTKKEGECPVHCQHRNIFHWSHSRRVLYSTANDPQPRMIPRPQMILDRKWSPKSTANDPERKIGMTWTQELADHGVDFIVITKRQIKS